MKTGRLFRAHGEFCASHPWEVIVALITFTACMLSVDNGKSAGANSGSNMNGVHDTESAKIKPMHLRQCHGWRDSCDGFESQYVAADVILMTIVRCSAVLYCYYQFVNLHKLGSKYILGKFFDFLIIFNFLSFPFNLIFTIFLYIFFVFFLIFLDIFLKIPYY